MAYYARATELFFSQTEKLNPESKRQLTRKIELVEQNPYRYSGISGYHRSLFKFRFRDNQRDLRAIYTIKPPYVTLLCIVDRKRKYKDLRSYLKRLGHL